MKRSQVQLCHSQVQSSPFVSSTYVLIYIPNFSFHTDCLEVYWTCYHLLTTKFQTVPSWR